jgi:SAM-dependent methyltransferase
MVIPLSGLKRTAGWRLLRGVKRALRPPTVSDQVPPSSWQGEVTILAPPVALEAGQKAPWPVRIKNTGPAAFPARSTAIVGRWTSRLGELIGEPVVCPLLRPIYSGEETTLAVSVPAPSYVGDYTLSLSLTVAGRTSGSPVTVAVPVQGRRISDIDYHAVYRTADLSANHWWVVGAYHTREQYERSKRERREMLTRYGLTPDARVLDVGCGTGQMADALTDYLSDRGAYFGTDIGVEAIAFCRRTFPRPNFRFEQGGMTTLPVGPADGPFDLAIYFSVFTHTFVDESALLLAETRRVLAPSGRVVVDVITSELCERGAGHRGEMVVNREYFLRLCGAVGFTAEEIGRWDWNPHAVRIMFALKPI